MKIIAMPKLDLRLVFTVDESEARALEALAGYGDNAFIKVFYEHLGSTYMSKHEDGLRSFLISIREILPIILARQDQARKTFEAEL